MTVMVFIKEKNKRVNQQLYESQQQQPSLNIEDGSIGIRIASRYLNKNEHHE